MKNIIITIEHDPSLPEQMFVGKIEGAEYIGIVESGNSIGEVVAELGISMQVKDEFDSKNKS